MNKSDISQAARPSGDTARHGTLTRPRPSEGGPGVSAAVPPRPEAPARPSGWTGGRITALVIGVLVALISLSMLAGGAMALWYDRTQRDAGYVTSGIHHYSTAGSALATEPTELGSGGTSWLYPPALLDKFRIRVTPAGSGTALFVGIGPSEDVDRYLAGVSHTLISDFWDDRVEVIGGGTPASPPARQDFWVASTTGSGPQTLVWESASGSWAAVVMNADGTPGIRVAADLGARIPALLWIAVGLLAGGAVFAAGGAILIVGAIRRYRPSRASAV